MSNSLPAPGACPECGHAIEVIARTGADFGTRIAYDVLKWRCCACEHTELEQRRLADGADGDWPASKFAKPGVDQEAFRPPRPIVDATTER